MNHKGIQVTTGKVRFTYVNLFTPRAIEVGQEAKYSICLLIPKSDVRTVQAIQAGIEEARQYGMRAKWQGESLEAFRSPLRDGDEEREGAAYAGHYFMNAYTRYKPLVVDDLKQVIVAPEQVYSGCYGKAVLQFYAYSSPGTKGIACNLMGVQKLAEGEPLGGVQITAEVFDEAEDFLN